MSYSLWPSWSNLAHPSSISSCLYSPLPQICFGCINLQIEMSLFTSLNIKILNSLKNPKNPEFPKRNPTRERLLPASLLSCATTLGCRLALAGVLPPWCSLETQRRWWCFLLSPMIVLQALFFLSFARGDLSVLFVPPLLDGAPVTIVLRGFSFSCHYIIRPSESLLTLPSFSLLLFSSPLLLQHVAIVAATVLLQCWSWCGCRWYAPLIDQYFPFYVLCTYFTCVLMLCVGGVVLFSFIVVIVDALLLMMCCCGVVRSLMLISD